MTYNKSFYRFLLYLISFSYTIIYYILFQLISIDTPLFILEYHLIILLMAINMKPVLTFLFYIFIFLLTIAILFSKLYLFNLSNFIGLLTYFNNYNFNLNHALFFICIFFYFLFLFALLKKINNNLGFDIFSIFFFFIITSFILLLDITNGTNMINTNKKLNFYKLNFAGLISDKLIKNIINRNDIYNLPVINTLQNTSVTFNEFALDSIGNQMLIIVESFGYIKDSNLRKKMQEGINLLAQKKKLHIKWGISTFAGSTTNAELRELLNCVGNYQYFNNPNHQNDIQSIFQIKNNQDYNTNAIHSYKGDMFERNIWWKNIGVENTYFLEDYLKKNKFFTIFNNETPFTSIYDEAMFDFIQTECKNKKKSFTYILTENSHLPYIGSQNNSIIATSSYFKYNKNWSVQSNEQLKRIINYIEHVILHNDTSKYNKILIIGDHMPPFLDMKDRDNYDNNFIPYLLLYR